MASINTVFRLRDKATKTIKSVESGMKNIVMRNKEVSNSNMGLKAGVAKITPHLQNNLNKISNINDKQREINSNINKMSSPLNKVISSKQRLLGSANSVNNSLKQQGNTLDSINRKTQTVGGSATTTLSKFNNWMLALTGINQGLQLIKQGAGLISNSLKFTDQLASTKARLDLINDSTMTTVELQDKLYKSAQNSRGEYLLMEQSVAKLGLLAKEAFSGNDEVIKFAELLNKSFKVGGASVESTKAATYQLTQAMAAGKLQGDEFVSIMENAPVLAESIAKELGKSKGELKTMSAEGKITSDIIKNAMFSASDEINRKFNSLPKTFGDITTQLKNEFTMKMQGIAQNVSKFLNSKMFTNFISGLSFVIDIIVGGIGIIANALMYIFDIINYIQPFIMGAMIAISGYITANLINSLFAIIPVIWAKAYAWMAVNYQMLVIIFIAGLLYSVLSALKAPLEVIVMVISLIVAVVALWYVVQWALNSALYACPLVWIIVLVMALIVAVYMLIQWIAKLTGTATSGLGIIAGSVNVVINFFKNLGMTVANIALGIWEAMKAVGSNMVSAFKNSISGVKSMFYGLLKTVTNVILGIVNAINKIPFINIDTGGLQSAARNFVDKEAQARGEKVDYASLGDAFSKGSSTFKSFEKGWAGKAFSSGRQWGDTVASNIGKGLKGLNFGNIKNAMKNAQNPMKNIPKMKNIDTSGIKGLGKNPSGRLGSAGRGGNVPVDIKKNSDKEVKISDEDIRLLKDIANKEYMVNYRQITPNVNMNFGDIRETADINVIKDKLQQMMKNELSELYVEEES